MSITYSDWTPAPDTGPQRSGIGAALAARRVRESKSLRERLPSIAISILANGAMAWLLVAVSMTAIKQVEEPVIMVSIATEVSRPEPPPPLEMAKLPKAPADMPQIAPPLIEIAAPPPPAAIQAMVAAPPRPPQPEKPVEEAPASPPRFDADYLNNPATVYPNMSRRLRETGTVQLRVRVSAAGLPVEVLMNKSSGYARLDEAALAAVKKWKFQAAMRSGNAIEAWVLVPVEFSLTRS